MYHVGLIIVLITTPLTSGLVYQCNFQDPSLAYGEHRNVQMLSFTRQLPASRTSSHYCVVTTDTNDSFFQVKARTFGQSNGSLHVAIFDSRDSTIGHLDISANGPEETVTLCPQASGRKYFVLLTGTPNMHYTTEITDDVTEILLNETKSFEVSKSTTLFKFKLTDDVLTKKQLDITVLSPSDTVAYLKVSNICKQAMDTKYLDYLESSLRLTFGKQGRITLSRASPPSLLNTSGGFTYIGIALKKDTEKKSINLSLASSFDYSYSKPLCFLICLSFFGGILVSLWALLCFRDPYILPQEDNPVDSDNLNSLTASNAHSHLKENLKNLFSSCWKEREDGNRDELRPLVQRRTPLTWNELFGAMKKVLLGHWVARGPKTFSYTTCIVGFALLIGAFQFVFETWKEMIKSGDRDRCYYNDFCYRVSDYDIPFNLMISNLVYMIHGLILACSVWVMEAGLLAWCHRLACHKRSRSRLPEGQDELPNHCVKCPCIDAHLANMSVPHFQPANGDEAVLLNAEAYKRKYSFSIGYSFAWALIFEGCFSMLYHFCPKKLTFQFDSAFMFVISGLIVVSLYNGTSFKECTVHGKTQPPVHSNNFFLFFILPLYIFNYFGSLYFSDESNLSVGMKIAFITCLVAYALTLFYWIGKKLFMNVSNFRDCDVLTKIVAFALALSVVIVLPVVYKRNFPNIFLFGCIFSSLLAICGKVIVELWRSDLGHWTVRKFAFHFLQGSYVLVTLGIMATAVWIFLAKATTNKEKSPLKSRDLNHDCVVLGFFDDHDLWHILSSFSLLMGSYLILYISK
ncbi:uncharacterized protein [Acropora muricata]|uniref:uncharacterized protein n=1 Tax=Acropora muricata TaxID=159855 RepID=UPI0034E3B9A5